MPDRDTALETKLRTALDISTPDLTPDESTRADIRSRMKARGSIGRLVGRHGFIPAPAGSFGAIAAAAVLALLVLTGPRQMDVNSSVAGAYVASIDTSLSMDSIAMNAADSLLYHVSPDSLGR